MKDREAENLIGCCGLYCGLCNKYQSKAPSRCIGCRLGEQHSWCSIWNCCVKRHGFETCTECREVFDCAIFLRRKVVEWIPAVDNLRQIKDVGLKKWLKEQKERQALLETLLENYNEGRSMNLYCKACARMPIDVMNRAIEEAKERLVIEKADKSDVKAKAKILKAVIKDLALKTHINLK
ncbi:MAG: DUF3795 domain-containing protein [Sedimentisphaerales bacterium]|nr:DUF3795 domain-containing protein [Sedimentisphaerales bacterium]